VLKKYFIRFWKSLEHKRRYKIVKLTLGKRNNDENIDDMIGIILDEEVPGVGESHTVFVSRSCRSEVSEREYKLAEILPLEDLQTSHGQRLQHAEHFHN
jgi:hypothetical protein